MIFLQKLFIPQKRWHFYLKKSAKFPIRLSAANTAATYVAGYSIRAVRKMAIDNNGRI
jgi:hypothetical protein